MRFTLATSLETLGHKVVVQSGEVAEFVSKCQLQRLDGVVLDLHLGSGPTGADAAWELRKTMPNLGIVFLTSFEDPRLLGGTKGSLPEDAVYLVKREVTSIEVIESAINKAMTQTGEGPKAQGLGLLTDSQIAVLRLIAQGASNSEIGNQLHITERSVESSVSRIAKALGIAKKPDANQRVNMAKAYFRARGVEIDG